MLFLEFNQFKLDVVQHVKLMLEKEIVLLKSTLMKKKEQKVLLKSTMKKRKKRMKRVFETQVPYESMNE